MSDGCALLRGRVSRTQRPDQLLLHAAHEGPSAGTQGGSERQGGPGNRLLKNHLDLQLCDACGGQLKSNITGLGQHSVKVHKKLHKNLYKVTTWTLLLLRNQLKLTAKAVDSVTCLKLVLSNNGK